MDYKSRRTIDMSHAQSVADGLNNSTDKYVVYKESRPITCQIQCQPLHILHVMLQYPYNKRGKS